ncbi:low-density lipoprotein receptor [Ceratitis capitata]|uniref:Basement membrane-specific heparan sulfate proteoglycan core protein n=1 Tax=Ceratitis capitata TaxID=7213 RepID=W8CD32_CERCA|nr:low-density lipoprotein receptor [Ceratitis capitata]
MRVILVFPICCILLNIYANGDDCQGAKCADGECIDDFSVCNGLVDCRDGTDESDCGDAECQDSDFKCHYGACIPSISTCNQKFDCLDGSDESFHHCPHDKLCSREQFQCGYGGCIELSKKCDSIFDCPDRTDEYPPLCEPET